MSIHQMLIQIDKISFIRILHHTALHEINTKISFDTVRTAFYMIDISRNIIIGHGHLLDQSGSYSEKSQVSDCYFILYMANTKISQSI